jgi:hypothetical protein
MQLPEQWFRKGVSTSWPPQYPDLTSLDFFLWDFAKNEISILPTPKTLDNLTK